MGFVLPRFSAGGFVLVAFAALEIFHVQNLLLPLARLDYVQKLVSQISFEFFFRLLLPNNLSQNRKMGGLLCQVIWQKQPKEKLEGNLAHKFLNVIQSGKRQKQVLHVKNLESGERDQNEPASREPR